MMRTASNRWSYHRQAVCPALTNPRADRGVLGVVYDLDSYLDAQIGREGMGVLAWTETFSLQSQHLEFLEEGGEGRESPARDASQEIRRACKGR